MESWEQRGDSLFSERFAADLCEGECAQYVSEALGFAVGDVAFDY